MAKRTVTTKRPVKKVAKNPQPVKKKKTAGKTAVKRKNISQRVNRLRSKTSTRSKNKNPNVVIVGAGKVAHAFAALFKEMGWKIDGVIGRSGERASALAKASKTKTLRFSKEPLDADIIVLAIDDSNVKEASIALYPMLKRGSTLLFTGGSTSKKDFPRLVGKGVHVIGFHPIQTFTQIKFSSDPLKNITFGLEASKADEKIIQPILKATRGKTISISSDQKILYHAAIVMAANLYVGLWSRMESAFTRMNGAAKSVRDALAPLVRQTVENILSAKGLLPFSGPVARADAETVGRHRKALRPFEKAEKLYTILSRELVRLGTKQKKFSKKQLRRLKKVLK